jgi:hypothetical protein
MTAARPATEARIDVPPVSCMGVKNSAAIKPGLSGRLRLPGCPLDSPIPQPFASAEFVRSKREEVASRTHG